MNTHIHQTTIRPQLRQASVLGASCLIAVALGSSAFGQAIYEQRFNEVGDIDFKNGAKLGPDGSGVSGQPADKAYSADTTSAPTASAVVTAPGGMVLEELTVTAWYKPRAEVLDAVTLFNAFGSLLIWDANKNQWIWRVGAKPVDPKVTMYWFYSGKAPVASWVAPGEWTFIALVWKRADSSAKFYQARTTDFILPAREMKRGEQVAAITLQTDARGIIGGDEIKKERAFNGEIDNVRFFPKALEADALDKIREADMKNEALTLP